MHLSKYPLRSLLLDFLFLILIYGVIVLVMCFCDPTLFGTLYIPVAIELATGFLIWIVLNIFFGVVKINTDGKTGSGQPRRSSKR